MMHPYTGNSAYCYANSLHMSLCGAGAITSELPETSFLECLTTMPFGTMYLALEDGPLAFFSSPALNPDTGLTRALETLGWTCQEQRGGEANEALSRLREATTHAPVLVGPIDMGFLSYHPEHTFQQGSDHFVTVLAVEKDYIVMHDPQGYPCAILPHNEFLQAWQAEHIPYQRTPYTFRSAFRKIELVNRQEMIARTLPLLHSTLGADPNGPVVYGGPRVFSLLAKDLRESVPASLAGHLLHFALPLAARRCLDASFFLEEAQREEAATIMEQKSHLFGIAQYRAAHQQWMQVADIMEQLGVLETRLMPLL